MQLGRQPRLLALEVGAQGIGEEVVVAVAVGLAVEGHHELQLTAEFAQHRRGVVATYDRIAHRGVELVEDGGPPQEVTRPAGSPARTSARR